MSGVMRPDLEVAASDMTLARSARGGCAIITIAPDR